MEYFSLYFFSPLKTCFFVSGNFIIRTYKDICC